MTRSSWLRSRRAVRGAAIAVPVLQLLSAAPAHAAEGGLEIIPDFRRLVLLMALFAALRFLLQPLLFAPLLAVLDARRERIEGARQRATEVAARAEETLTRYRSSLRSTQGEAEAERRSSIEAARAEQRRIGAEARAEAEREIEAARQEIAAALSSARAGLRTSAEELARAAASRVLGRALS